MRHCLRIVVVVLLIASSAAAWAWFSPSGTGESADSPDGRYRAHAMNMHRGAWHGRISYIHMEVEEIPSGRAIWRADRYPLPTETPPDFGDRSRKFVQWSSDSRTVSIPVGGSSNAVWSVP